MNIFKKSALALAAVLAIAAPIASPAAAAPQGNIVTFGDSYVANAVFKGPGVAGMTWTRGCIQDPHNWPRRLGEKMHLPVTDYSCNGHTSRQTLDRVSEAARNGDINRSTKYVIISTGINNYWLPGYRQGLPIWDHSAIVEHYLSDMAIAVHEIRLVAPQAKIVFSGMLSVSEPDGLQSVCWLHAPGIDLGSAKLRDTKIGITAPPVQAAERSLAWAQSEAARRAGAQFVNIKELLKHGNTCSNANGRFVSGYSDTVSDYNMVFHPTGRGNEFVASHLAEAI